MAEILERVITGLFGVSQETSDYIREKKKKRFIERRKRNSLLIEALKRLGIDYINKDCEFFSLHKNPYFIEDFVNKPENPFQYKPL